MKDPVGKWHEEHMYFHRLLELLRHEVDQLALGETPNYALMLDIIDYLRDYSDHVHHPREDAVFRRLARYCPDRELPLARLRQEHRIIAHTGQALRALLQEAASDAVVPRAEIEVAAASYLVYYGNHIEREEEDIMPLARKLLGDDDWQAARDVVPSASDPMLGPDPQERFRALRRRIALEAGVLP